MFKSASLASKKMENQKSSDYKYLEKLEFRPELKNSWLNFFVSNFRVVILLIILLSASGIYSYSKLPVESDPEVTIPIAVVVTTFPGASPADIEELVTKKIENEIGGLKNINKVTSNSYNSVSSITVEYNADADLDDSIRKLRDAVNNVKTELPSEADESIVKEISIDDNPMFSISIAGPYDGLTLRKFAEDIQDELDKIPGVREVTVSGGDQREIEIAYDPAKLSTFNLSVSQINQIVASTNSAVPSGNFSGEKYNYSVRTDSRFFDAQSLREIPIFHGQDNSVVFLKDVARVEDRSIEKTVLSRFSQDGNQPQDSVSISIIKKTGGSIVETADASKKKIDEIFQNAPSGMHYDITIDTAKEIKKNFEQLVHDFTLTVILVFGILLLIVGLKEALVASLAIPLVFFATFGVMLKTGISLNFLSMISLILALGLLVDDAIVVVSATKQYLKTGKFTPEEAVLLVLNDFKVVLATTTLTTVWAFLPLLFSTGIMGQYIRSIPITVSVTLIASLIIALIINHPLAAVLERVRLTRRSFFFYIVFILLVVLAGFLFASTILKGTILSIGLVAVYWMMDWYFKFGKKKLQQNREIMDLEWKNDDLIKQKLASQGSHENSKFMDRIIHGIVRFDKVIPVYEKYLRLILSTKKNRIKTLAWTFALFVAAISLPIVGIVKSEFFPVTDQELIFINIEAPVGLKLEENEKIISEIEQRLLKYPEIVNFSTVIGSGGSMGGFGGGGSNSSYLGEITVKIKEKEQRQIKSYDLAEKIREDIADIQGAKITVESLRGGPPSGAAFEARIAGDNLDVLAKVADDLKPMLSSIEGVVDSNVSLKDSPADYTFALDHQKMERSGLNASQVGATIRMAISGTEVTKIFKDNEELKVVARFADDKIPNLISLENLQLKNSRNEAVFLKDVAEVKLEPSLEKITRVDQKRTVLLSAGVSGKTAPADVVKEFQDKVFNEYELPQGYEISYGGENEQNTESVESIIRAMVIALVLIISTLVIQFNSFKKSAIVLVTIPLALIGVFVGMAIFGIKLSFPGLIGIVALFGIVVKNAIILVDKINLNMKTGIVFEESIIDAGKSRLEAIFITSICTIAGIVPVTISNETWLALGSAIVFGLLLSSFFTLFIVPTLYFMLVKREG